MVTNLQSKSFDLVAVKEILRQANRTLYFADDGRDIGRSYE